MKKSISTKYCFLLIICMAFLCMTVCACTSSSAFSDVEDDTLANTFVVISADVQEEDIILSDDAEPSEDDTGNMDNDSESSEDEEGTNSNIEGSILDDTGDIYGKADTADKEELSSFSEVVEESIDESVSEDVPVVSDNTTAETDISSQISQQSAEQETSTDDISTQTPEQTNNTANTTDTEENINVSQASETAGTVSQAESYVSGGFPLWNYSWHSGAYIGRMRIPSVGVNVGLYNTCEQYAIDAWDSAAIAYHWKLDHDQTCYSTIYCCDHNYQGFDVIVNCSVGDAMYIDGVDGNTYKYICDHIDYNGYNTGYGLNDSSGNTVNYTGGLWVYTCHEGDLNSVYMVHFHAV